MGSSIPLPALDLKQPAPPPDAIEQYGRLAALRNSLAMQPLQQQAAQQQVQSGELENQTKQIQLQQAQQGQQDQQYIRQLATENKGKTVGELADIGLQSGKLSPQTYTQLKKSDLEQRSSLESLTKEQLANADASHKQLQQYYDAAQDMTPEQLQQNWPAIVQQVNSVHTNTPLHLDPNQPMTKEQLQQFAPFISMQGTYLSEAAAKQEKAAKTAETQAQTGKAVADTARAAAETAIIPQTLQNSTMARKQEQQRIGIEGARLAFEQKKYATENGTGGDGNALTDAIGSGHLAPDRMAYLLTKNPGLMQSVIQKYPDFDSSKVASYPQVYKDFTSGATSKALNAGGTALGHLAELKDLNTYSSRIPGTEAHQKYENKVDTLATELAKFYGDSTVSGIANIKSTLNANFNRDAAIQTQAQSMGDKLDAFKQQWDNAAPSKAYQAPMPGISAKAIAARERLAGNTSSTPPARPQGVPANAVWNAQGNNGSGSWQIK